jgi:hypothetical protein
MVPRKDKDQAKSNGGGTLRIAGVLGAVVAGLAVFGENLDKLEQFYQEHFLTRDERLKRQFADEAQAIVHGKWVANCGFHIPDRWELTADDGNGNQLVAAPSGTAVSQAKFELAVEESGGAVGESKFYNDEIQQNRYNRGFVLTHSDYVEAYMSFAPEELKDEPKQSHLVDRDLNFVVQYEDGRSMKQEPIELWRGPDGNGQSEYTMTAMIRPTDVSAAAQDRFTGYEEFTCSARSIVGSDEFANLCIALIEATTRGTTIHGTAIECHTPDLNKPDDESSSD